MNRPIAVRFISPSPGVSEVTALGTLTRLFKGNEAKADQVLTSKNAVLQRVATEEEGRLVIARLKKLGLECRMDIEEDVPFEDDVAEGHVHLVTCPHCGVRQEAVSSLCRHCGHPFDADYEARIGRSGVDPAETQPSRHPVLSRIPRLAASLIGLILVLGVAVLLGGDRLLDELGLGIGPLTGVQGGRILFGGPGGYLIDAKGVRRDARRGELVESGDTLVTTGSRIEVAFSDGGKISLLPGSEFNVADYRYSGKPDGTEKGVFRLLKGGLHAITGAIGKGTDPDAYRVDTQAATIGIRGTEYVARISEGLDGYVISGGVVVANRAGTIVLQTGQGFYSKDFDTPPVIRPTPAPIEGAPPPPPPPSATGMILEGVARSAAQGTIEPTTYDPESGVNPYAERLKSLGVDVQRLKEVQGHPDGIRPDQLQDAVRKVPGASGMIEGHTREPGAP